MRYHQERARFLNTAHLSIQFMVFALVSSSVYCLIMAWFDNQALLVVSAVVGLLALFSLVFNPAEKSALHKSLYRSFTMLAGTIAATPESNSKETRAVWAKSIHLLYAEEPPVFRALHAHCENQMVIALGADLNDHFVDMEKHQRRLRNWFRFQDEDFPSRKQKREADQKKQ